MDWEFFEAFKETPAFVNLWETSWALLESIMSAPTEIINTKQVVEELAHEMEIEAKIDAPEVAKVLAEVPKSRGHHDQS